MAIWRKISLRVHVKRNWKLPSADQSCSNKPGQALPVTSLRDARPRRPGVWAQHGALCRSCTVCALLAMHFIVWPRRQCWSYTVRALCRSCSVCAVYAKHCMVLPPISQTHSSLLVPSNCTLHQDSRSLAALEATPLNMDGFTMRYLDFTLMLRCSFSERP